MSFDEGMRLFRSGDIPGACDQFHQAVEQDENNHKAWNALGICLSKTGEYEDAETCFENALMLDPGNATYEKNREKNDQKRPVGWKVREKEEKVTKQELVAKSEPSSVSSMIWSGVKVLGGVIIFLFICMIVAAFVFGFSGGTSSKQTTTQSQAAIITHSPTQQVTITPTQTPVVYTFSGESPSSTDFFYLEKGIANIQFSVGSEYYNGGSLKDADGKAVDIIINQVKPGSGNKKVRILHNGNYYVDMHTADWSLKITQ